MNNILISALSILGTLLLTSIYRLISASIRKRVTVKSPEMRAIEQLIPTVNMLLDMQGPQITVLITILEVQKGICNGNIEIALEKAYDYKKRFDDFLMAQAKVEP